jgi:hypothetical protein
MNNNSIFGKDTPMGRPEVNDRAGIFVPAAGSEKGLPATVKNGAGIVGFGNNDGTLMIYFESNRFNDDKLHTWVSKVRLSYDRMVKHAPTTSHMTMTPDLMEQIGLIDGSGVEITQPQALQRWLAYCNATDSAPEKTTLKWTR